ncbi:hypothetical protein [Butyrivibrio sp. AE2032]|uniref:hypothetical protein n=1 Tax=Butyrivibrio sp. AE2032 TaxID=1458463 RepID=UPI00068CB215|nr:hypothetical protein [Butyrivibrio sp. AE2032]
MVSLLTMIVNAVTSALIYALKAFFSLLTWFGKSFLKFLKLLYVVLPITCIVFVLLFLVNIFVLCTGKSGIIRGGAPEIGQPGMTGQEMSGNPAMPSIPDINIPGDFVDDAKVQQEAGNMLLRDRLVVSNMFGELKTWWTSNVYSYHGSTPYIFLLILTILMFLPVVSILLVFSVFASFGNILFISVVVDAALYLIRAITGATFLKQAQGRYFRLFPEAGRRHYEKSYDKFLKNRDKEMREELRHGKRAKAEDFYGDEEDYDEEQDDYYEDDQEEYEDRRHFRKHHGFTDEDFFENDVDEEDFYEDEEDYYEDEDDFYEDEDDFEEDEDVEEDYEDDYDEPRDRRHQRDYDETTKKGAGTSGTFDFFAGCTSRESVDKKYKSLVKLYHPDNMDGDTAALQEINSQYAEAKKRFG